METTSQDHRLSRFIIAVLICLLAALAFFTWHLSTEVQSMRETIAQANTVPPASAVLNTAPPASNPPASAVSPRQPTPANPDPQPPVSGPSDPYAAPFPDSFQGPFARNWPGFMDPSGQIAEMQRRMDELMNSMTQGFPFFNQQDFGFINSGPAISMTETPDAYQVTIAVPDGQEVELNTELNNNTLVVSGSVKSEREENGNGLSSRSMQESRFSQSMHLPGELDEAGMRIEQADGQIVVTVPKA